MAVWAWSPTPLSRGVARRPSTADVMETAGVSTESARNVAPPIMAKTDRPFQCLRTRL